MPKVAERILDGANGKPYQNRVGRRQVSIFVDC